MKDITPECQWANRVGELKHGIGVGASMASATCTGEIRSFDGDTLPNDEIIVRSNTTQLLTTCSAVEAPGGS
jgi:hypothetical protein